MVTRILQDPHVGSTSARVPWKFILPGNFDACLLPTSLLVNADEGRYLLDTITRKTIARRLDRSGFARLKEQYFRKVMSHRQSRRLIGEIQGLGIIEVDQSYCPGVYSKGYRLSPTSLAAGHIRMPPTNPGLIEKLRRRADVVSRLQAQRCKPIHRKLNEIQLAHLTVDAHEAEHELLKLRQTSRLCQGVLVENLIRRTLGNSISGTGRWFNAITGLKKELRPCLRLDGEPLAAVDLECCQVALLGLAIQANLTPGGWKGVETYKIARPLSAFLLSACEVRCSSSSAEFVELASSGEFYDKLAEKAGVVRDEAKRRFLVDCLAPRDRYPSVVREAFEELFPGVAALIRGLNRDNHCTTIRILQEMESWLVIETVAPRLVDRIPVVPLHDAIYSREYDIHLVEEAFEDTFKEIGYRISMKRESAAARSADGDSTDSSSSVGTGGVIVGGRPSEALGTFPRLDREGMGSDVLEMGLPNRRAT